MEPEVAIVATDGAQPPASASRRLRLPGQRPAGSPACALGLIAAALVLTALTVALGPSAAVPRLPGGVLPLRAEAHPPAGLVTALLALAALAGAVGLLLALRALRHGWSPRPRRLVAAGALAAAGLGLLSPVASADALNYAAYGRMVAVGADPYTTTPQQLADAGDPVGAAVPPPWQRAPSDYGPVATAEQGAVVAAVGPRPALAVCVLDLVNAALFVAAGLALDRAAGRPAARRRVALLWTLNPLVLIAVVAGGHLDALVVACVAAAVLALRRARGAAGLVGAGALAGAAVAVKAPAGLAAVGLGWPLVLRAREAPRRLASYAVGGLAVAVTGYVVAGPELFTQLRTASRYVAHATPWHAVSVPLDQLVGYDASRRVIGLLALAVGVLLLVALLRGLPQVPPEWQGARIAAALVLAWTLSAAYALPWYDALPWALLALVPPSAYDALLVVHTTVLLAAYDPGLVVHLPGGVDAVTTAFKEGLAPALLAAVIVTAAVVSFRDRPTRLPGAG